MTNIAHWIALEQTDGIGPAHLKEIHRALSGPGLSVLDLFDLEEDEIVQELHLNRKTAEAVVRAKMLLQRIEEDYFAIIDSGSEVIPFFSEKYPLRLQEIMGNTAPPLLYVLGSTELLNARGIAILGDKFVSPKGSEIAFTAARELASRQIITTSGYASGVDMIAHRAALEQGGKTAAVLPYGILKFRPHDSLIPVLDPERFTAVSPFYPTEEANKFNAYIRNKIACALAMAVYIVESPSEGGVYEAAKSAHKLKIPLFTTQYGSYPENALGNEKIIGELGGLPVKGRYVNDLLVPNLEKMIGIAKFN